jgi:hypothetical protein
VIILPNMTQIRHIWAGVTNFIPKDRHYATIRENHAGPEKMGHSYIEEYFNLHHSAIRDTLSTLQLIQELLS